MQIDPAWILGAAGAIGAFLAYFIKDVIADARRQRDEAFIMLRGQAAATEKLATALDRLSDLLERPKP